jgi:hypothetical protein
MEQQLLRADFGFNVFFFSIIVLNEGNKNSILEPAVDDVGLSGACPSETLMGAFKKLVSKLLLICPSPLLRREKVRASALMFLPLVLLSIQICV